MSSVANILQAQVIRVKKGRLNGLGFEPAFNSYFDYYLSPKYINPPLLRLEDVTFHLFLRKNLNDTNPSWNMPSINQMMRRLAISYTRLSNIMARLEGAVLLEKESGLHKGEAGRNISNTYVLSDPIATLEEFLVVASSNTFARPLRAEWQKVMADTPYRGFRDSLSRIPNNPPIAETAEYKQTLKKETEEDLIWFSVLEALKTQMPYQTFHAVFSDTRLLKLDGPTAKIEVEDVATTDWAKRQLERTIARLINLEAKLMDVEVTVKEIEFVAKTHLENSILNTPSVGIAQE